MEITMMLGQQEHAVKALEQRARREATRAGLMAYKSRRGIGSIDNHGGFRIVDPILNTVEVGESFDLSAEEVIAYCADK